MSNSASLLPASSLSSSDAFPNLSNVAASLPSTFNTTPVVCRLREYLKRVGALRLDKLPLDPDHCLLSGSVLVHAIAGDDLDRWQVSDFDLFCHKSHFHRVLAAFKAENQFHMFGGCLDFEDAKAWNENGARAADYRTDSRITSVHTYCFKKHGYASAPDVQFIVVKDEVPLWEGMVGSFDLSIVRNAYNGTDLLCCDPAALEKRYMTVANAGDVDLLNVWSDPEPCSFAARVEATKDACLRHRAQFERHCFVALDRSQVFSCGLYLHLTKIVNRIRKYQARGFKLVNHVPTQVPLVKGAAFGENWSSQVSSLVADFEYDPFKQSFMDLYTMWYITMQARGMLDDPEHVF